MAGFLVFLTMDSGRVLTLKSAEVFLPIPARRVVS